MNILKQILIVLVLAAGGYGVWYFLLAPDDPARDPSRAAAASGPATPPAAVPVVVEPAYTGPVETTLDAIGTVRANEAVQITAKTAGVVQDIPFEDGAEVAIGTIIAVLDSAELAAERDSAAARRTNAQRLLDQATTLASSNTIARSQVEDLQATLSSAEADLTAAEARLAEREIRAPFSGTLGIRRVSRGAFIAPGTEITSLDDLSSVRVDFSVPETMLAALDAGMSIALRTDAWPDRAFAGSLTSIDTRIDPVTRAIAAVARVPNGDRLLRPGMFVTIRITTQQDPSATLVSEQALLPEGDRQFVFVVSGDRAERREIRIGRRIPGAVEVLDGLEPGEPVAVQGLQRLRDGVPVTVLAEG